jgi:hypothetical protein
MVLDSLGRTIFEHAFPSESPSLPNIIGDFRKLKINIGDGIDGIEVSGMCYSVSMFSYGGMHKGGGGLMGRRPVEV